MIETLPPNSLFLTIDQRKDRWAIPYNYESTNCRIENIIINNKKHIKDKKVLDLGCHFGTFAFAALQHGAASVCGIDSEKKLIDQAEELFSHEQISTDKYEFHCNDIIKFLKEDDRTFDTILCLGIFYYINDPIEFLKLMRKKAKVIILDTFTAYYSAVVSKDGIAIANQTLPETFDLPVVFYPLTQAKKKDYLLHNSFNREKKNKALSMLTLPTIKAFEYFFELTGLDHTILNWDKYTKNNYTWRDFISIGVKKESHWADIYHTKIRATFVLKENPECPE